MKRNQRWKRARIVTPTKVYGARSADSVSFDDDPLVIEVKREQQSNRAASILGLLLVGFLVYSLVKKGK